MSPWDLLGWVVLALAVLGVLASAVLAVYSWWANRVSGTQRYVETPYGRKRVATDRELRRARDYFSEGRKANGDG